MGRSGLTRDCSTLLFLFSDQDIMTSIGGDGVGRGQEIATQHGGASSPNVADLLRNLNLTAEEGEVLEFSNDDDDGGPAVME